MSAVMNRPIQSEMCDRLSAFDFERHNADVADLWNAYRAARNTRVPIILGVNTRFFMRQPDANPTGLTFRRYMEDPDLMFDAQLRFQRWSRFNLLQDAELGMPEVWRIHVDFQNYYEAAWFGCPVEYFSGEVPDTRPAFQDCPERVMEKGLPRPFGGLMARALDYYDRYLERARQRPFLNRPVEPFPPWCGVGTDGPMTVACNLFSPEFVCMAMAAEPKRLHVLLDFITQATIKRMMVWRKLTGMAIPCDDFVMADDSIALISKTMYKEHILPFHRRLYDAFGTKTGRAIHLCGDSTRHFRTLVDELDICSFDTGFPVDFGRLREELGPGVRIQGGPNVKIVHRGTPCEIWEETRRILQTGALEGGLFVLREGNNLAPGTPLENTEALYYSGREFGRLEN